VQISEIHRVLFGDIFIGVARTGSGEVAEDSGAIVSAECGFRVCDPVSKKGIAGQVPL
jgi:hypothetical protein